MTSNVIADQVDLAWITLCALGLAFVIGVGWGVLLGYTWYQRVGLWADEVVGDVDGGAPDRGRLARGVAAIQTIRLRRRRPSHNHSPERRVGRW
jgi:hypothetical protein